jgi:hypothetical protein
MQYDHRNDLSPTKRYDRTRTRRIQNALRV